MTRAVLIVLDSVGIGGAEDAAAFGDAGADTFGHIAMACADGAADREDLRSGPLSLPNLDRLGLGYAARLSTGRALPTLGHDGAPAARYAADAGASWEVQFGQRVASSGIDIVQYGQGLVLGVGGAGL